MSRLFSASLAVSLALLSNTPSELRAQDSAAVGKCFVNRRSGQLVGRIVAIAPNPASRQRGYKVEDRPGSYFYLAPSIGTVVECNQARGKQATTDTLVGQCAYNRSDSRMLGRVIRTETSEQPGQRRLVVALERSLREQLGTSSMDVTYPRNAILRRCK